MTRDTALRLDAMLMHLRGELDMVAHFMKRNLSEEKYEELIYSIGSSSAELIDISNALYARFSDIVPTELKPR